MPDQNEYTRQSLFGEWIRSQEEDLDGAMVLRRPGYEFPPARARKLWSLRGDGMEESSSGPDDRVAAGPTESWLVEADGILIFSGAGGQSKKYKIIATENDRLVVKPLD